MLEWTRMQPQPNGTLVIIGGHEDKGQGGERDILSAVVEAMPRGRDRLVIMTVATRLPEEVATEYTGVFKDLGVRAVEAIDMRSREDAFEETAVAALKD